MKLFDVFRRPLQRPQRGQTLVIVALGSLVLMGALGLALDLGYNYGQRRGLQNIADAAALRGAYDVKDNGAYLAGLSGATAVTTTNGDVKAIARANGLADPAAASPAATLTCEFVRNDGAATGASGCATLPIPGDATGVRVRVAERHVPFVMRALGITSTGTGATATAHVEVFDQSGLSPEASPFIICGFGTMTVGANGQETPAQNYPRKSILATDASGYALWTELTADGTAKLNLPGHGGIAPYIAIGPSGDWVKLHDTRSNGASVALCGTQNGQGFQGVNDQGANVAATATPDGVNKGVPIVYKTGSNAGPVGATVNAVGACTKGASNPDACLMWLPILDNKVVGTPSNKQANLVGYGFFLVKNVSNGNSNNYHIAQLTENAVVQGRGTRDWDPTKTHNALVVRLTE